ncbi:hypothetical protein FMM80_09370 [Schaedlerella arabinosiphila]|uniref:AAA-ATPase-like domain-containing protein n=1 Tax=Schaedlerella arabinosiphila TaxID=2044587 RepID=A0A9X5C7A8_9FIRM|nr:AAA family ATPase [Schaedlerella arabinosiphila]NDO68878.1 hypothetical protein [Schaedlerella arabinosiphila]
MAKTVGIGHQNFEEVVTEDIFYIDKTRFIQEWWDNKDVVTLITRPRRFGKTLNLSMLETFFSVKYADIGDLFQNFLIWKDEKYRSLQGKYPVLFLSFAKVKEDSFVKTRKKICLSIKRLYNQYDFLLESDCLNADEKKLYLAVADDMEDHLASESLNLLSEYLMRYYGKKVMILLDEYDTPMHEAYAGGYWDELVSFIRSLFNATFKTNPSLEKALMTGITRVSKESVFSDLNNIEVVTTTSEKYSDSFGFTENEVWEALREYGLYEERWQVKDWYDGFAFGKIRDIYNPWSIINYLDKHIVTTYWANTSSNGLAGKLIREGSADMKMKMEDLLSGGTFHAQLDEQIIFSQLDSNENAVWSLLLAVGYMRVEKYGFNKKGRLEYELALTNREVSVMFEKMIDEWFKESTSSYNTFVKALLLGDVEAMNTYMNRVTSATFSYFDTRGNTSEETEPERFYHGFVLGLMTDLEDRYRITSNRESGFGRYDVMLEPLQASDDAVIIEFKVSGPAKKQTLEEAVKEALAQIDRMDYAASLEACGIPRERIRKYGFAFRGKQVLIGE